ncbi:uncharacterized protein KY384_005621 [Bacidia gigantensis]|uniref:uncharacterized protein n=1 Tax=Bacidia gigantensis TaxID=2732470 RepID=UPI001D056F4F|nr:uncharacterized protein KY384_005621 [Bacidia gigantensis]KAG8530138.1 hypothetical protein KY384_005621 [Bacidia gigantensis]
MVIRNDHAGKRVPTDQSQEEAAKRATLDEQVDNPRVGFASATEVDEEGQEAPETINEASTARPNHEAAAPASSTKREDNPPAGLASTAEIKEEDQQVPAVNNEASTNRSNAGASSFVNAEDKALASATEVGVEDQDVPATIGEFRNHIFNPNHPDRKVTKMVQLCTVHMIRQKRQITSDEKQAIFNMLKSLNRLLPVSTDDEKSMNITGMLRSINGEVPSPKGPYSYPTPLQRSADILHQRILLDIAVAESMEESKQSSSSPEPTAGTRGSKRKRDGAEPRTPASLPTDDPTFRECLRGIIIQNNPRSYRLDPEMTPAKRRSDIFGHNGLAVGQWWPLRHCALRDGAHGHIQGGIHGSANAGAYSIVVSGQYSALDVDNETTLYYSGSNSLTNTNPSEPIITYATKSLRVSYSTQRPIRVIRASGSDSQYAPSKGLRYDGLYRVTNEATEKNDVGGAYLRFKLVRAPNQPDIDSTRPTMAERRVWNAVKDV